MRRSDPVLEDAAIDRAVSDSRPTPRPVESQLMGWSGRAPAPPDIGGRRDHVRSYLESRHRPRRMSAEMTQIEFFVARYIFSGEHTFGFGRGCLHEQARQIRFIVLSPTTRRSILLIRSERSSSPTIMPTFLGLNALTFHPHNTIPPSTTPIYHMPAIPLNPN